MAGVTVYKHEDIPEQFHIKESKYVYDIILVADTGESCEYFWAKVGAFKKNESDYRLSDSRTLWIRFQLSDSAPKNRRPINRFEPKFPRAMHSFL